MKFLFVTFFLSINSISVSAQINSAKFNPFESYSPPFKIHIGEVIGYSNKVYDSLYNLNPPYLKESYPITKSKYELEVRMSCYGGFPVRFLHYDFIDLYYDTIFKVRYIDYSKDHGYLVTEPKGLINSDSLYNKLIQNGIFSLPDFNEIFNSKIEVLRLSKNNFEYQTIKEIKIDDGIGCKIEYKVGEVYRLVYFSLPEFYYQFYPDNQILRRYHEIVQLFKGIQ